MLEAEIRGSKKMTRDGRKRYAVDMKLWRLVASFVALILPAACASRPAPDQLFSPTQLSNLVTDRTLYVPFSSDTPNGVLLYLARDGTGWLDSQLVSGLPPQPSGMSTVFDWRAVDGSQVCLWASPRTGDMPSFTPPFTYAFKCFVLACHPTALRPRSRKMAKSERARLSCIRSTHFHRR